MKRVKSRKTKKRKSQIASRFFAKKRKRFLKLATQIQASLTLIALIFYVALGLFLGPPVLLKDLSAKNKALAETLKLGVSIIGLPEKPIISAITGCGNDNPYIELNWGDDFLSTTSYDIYRNGDMLISGIISSTYQDTAVLSDTLYTYYIIAQGPVGSTTSDEISATTEICSSAVTCQITNLAGINLINFQGKPETTDRTPQISGITNIANAQIEIALYTGPIILGSTTANINGFFSFTVPQNLNYKTHTIFVTARDPLDLNRFKQTSLQFKVEEAAEEKTTAEKIIHSPGSIIAPDKPANSLDAIPVWPFRFSLEITNNQKIAYLGQDLLFNIRLYDPQKETNLSAIPLKFQIFDAREKIIWESQETQNFLNNLILAKKIPLAYDLKTGKYQLKVTTALKNTDYSLSAEDSFMLKERPIIEVGSFSATATGILNYAGWILFLLILVLLFFLTLLYIEHQLARRALRQITEYELKRDAYIS